MCALDLKLFSNRPIGRFRKKFQISSCCAMFRSMSDSECERTSTTVLVSAHIVQKERARPKGGGATFCTTSVITEVPKTKGQGIWENPELKDFPVITCYTPRVEPSLIKIKKRRSESAAGLTTASLLFLSMKAGGGVIKSLLRYLNNFGNLLF